MKFLLPYRFRRAGSVMAPLGFIIWLAMQRGLVNDFFVAVFGPDNPSPEYPPYFIPTVIVACVSFCSFLFGLYFVTFSKEKEEDEMVRYLRLESFQFAAFSQLVVIIGSFIFMLVSGNEPTSDSGFSVFFLFGLVLYWMIFFARFRYVLYRRARLKG